MNHIPVETAWPRTPADRIENDVLDLHIIRDLAGLAEEIAGNMSEGGTQFVRYRDQVVALGWAIEKLLNLKAGEMQALANTLKESARSAVEAGDGS